MGDLVLVPRVATDNLRRDAEGDLFELVGGPVENGVFVRRYASDDRDWIDAAEWDAMEPAIVRPPVDYDALAMEVMRKFYSAPDDALIGSGDIPHMAQALRELLP